MTEPPHADVPVPPTGILRVAVDARFAVLDTRGIGRYTRAVAARLSAPDVALTLVAPGLFTPRREMAAAVGVSPSSVRRNVPSDADVIWNPSNGTNLESRAPKVTMMHDVAPFTFPAADPRVRAREQDPLLHTARVAQRILVNSAYTAGEVHRLLEVPRERIVVTPLGVEAPFTAGGDPFVLPDGRPYVLHVGAHDPRKNTAVLAGAWRSAWPSGDIALVFTRAPSTLPPGAVVIDAADDEKLAMLYRGARIVAIPSLDEGFGLPLLEALACGAPVLASRLAALPEVGGDAAAWVDEPQNIVVWSQALRTLARDEGVRSELAARGPRRAAAFTWERCTGLTLAALREAAWG
jgi:glycosyltransferase involved in cell wall biosynthesis